ncbi:MAG: transporter substrate-binding domain-containing protein [Eubacteriales bacterium]|nr:transporter substrate-binding domain-containing protein [Eubacteriales bacterium]
MKLRKTLLGLFTAASLLLCAGCGAASGGTSWNDTASDSGTPAEEQTFEIKTTDAIQDIIDRGYLIVGCKNDVPGLGYYNEETQAYEGGEIDLAYYLAAKIFDTSYDDAVKQQLVHFEPVQTDNREKALQDGNVDYIIATYTITDERKEVVDFSNSYYTNSIGLMVNTNSADNSTLREERIRSIVDLDNKYIGIISGSTTRNDFLNYIARNAIPIHPKFVTYSSYAEISEELEAGHIDVFCVDVPILKGYLNDDRKILNDRFASQDYGIAAAKGKDGLIDAANTVIEELQYNKIVLFS